MKKAKTKDKSDLRKNHDTEPDAVKEIEGEEDYAATNSIQEFIELKKLQNRILGKMLEKINQSENQTKPNNK